MLLGRVEPFRGLDERARLTVVEHAGRRVVDKGQMVFWQDDPGEAMFVLLEGSVKLVVCSRDGELIELHRHDAPAIFGELALLDGGPRSPRPLPQFGHVAMPGVYGRSGRGTVLLVTVPASGSIVRNSGTRNGAGWLP